MTVFIVNSLPDSIRVGGFDFRIEKWSASAAAAVQCCGEFSACEQTIRVQIDMPSRFKAVNTLLHEISHAIFWVYGIRDEDKEERIVSALGSAWMQVYRDNPWLLKWLAKALA